MVYIKLINMNIYTTYILLIVVVEYFRIKELT